MTFFQPGRRRKSHLPNPKKSTQICCVFRPLELLFSVGRSQMWLSQTEPCNLRRPGAGGGGGRKHRERVGAEVVVASKRTRHSVQRNGNVLISGFSYFRKKKVESCPAVCPFPTGRAARVHPLPEKVKVLHDFNFGSLTFYSTTSSLPPSLTTC